MKTNFHKYMKKANSKKLDKVIMNSMLLLVNRPIVNINKKTEQKDTKMLRNYLVIYWDYLRKYGFDGENKSDVRKFDGARKIVQMYNITYNKKPKYDDDTILATGQDFCDIYFKAIGDLMDHPLKESPMDQYTIKNFKKGIKKLAKHRAETIYKANRTAPNVIHVAKTIDIVGWLNEQLYAIAPKHQYKNN